MGTSNVIIMEKERLFMLTPGGIISQAENEAVDVLPYISVIPFLRIKKQLTFPNGMANPDTNYNLTSTGFQLRFGTSPGLMYPDEGALSGSRWNDTGYYLNITDGQSAFGLTYPKNLGVAPQSGTSPYVINPPGAKLIWYLQNLDSATNANQIFVGDIILVCRGY